MKIERMNEKLLRNISIDHYTSARELSIRLHSTEKTIRNHIYSLNDFLRNNGAHIQIKHGQGYRLIIDNEKMFSHIYTNGRITDIEECPATPEERVDYIICFLLMQNSFVNMLDLCEILNVSEATIITDIKNAKHILSSYQLKLISKRKEGTKISGEEFNIRLCMAEYLDTSKMLDINCRKQIKLEKIMISEAILNTFSQYHVSMPEVSLEKLINHIYISVRRIQNGCEICAFPKEALQIDYSELKDIALHLCNDLAKLFNITFSEDELDYILIYMIGQRINKKSNAENNVLLTGKTMDMVCEILDFIYKTMNIDFRNDFSLIMNLSIHMIPLIIRLNYHIMVSNPLLHDIKKNYPLSYTLSLQAAIIIENIVQEKLNEDEIGYLALIFEVAMKKNSKNKKKNIVIVCATGKTSAELLAFQYRKMFDEYLDKIIVCNIHELAELDFSNIDFVFTTTPINISIPVPIFDTKFTLGHEDVLDIYQKFENQDIDWLKGFYRKELFFDNVEFNNKNEVIRFMVREISKVETIPEDFFDSVIKRESIGSTDFGDYIALPHPYGIASERTFASVCVLNRPVFWGKHDVSVIILLSIADNEQDNLDRFYSATSDFMLSHDKNKVFMRNPSYDQMLKLLLES